MGVGYHGKLFVGIVDAASGHAYLGPEETRMNQTIPSAIGNFFGVVAVKTGLADFCNAFLDVAAPLPTPPQPTMADRLAALAPLLAQAIEALKGGVCRDDFPMAGTPSVPVPSVPDWMEPKPFLNVVLWEPLSKNGDWSLNVSRGSELHVLSVTQDKIAAVIEAMGVALKDGPEAVLAKVQELFPATESAPHA